MAGLMFKVVTVQEAYEILMPYFKNLSREQELVPVELSFGRYISKIITVKEDVPSFSRSTMDGFAVNSADTFGASAAMPAYLRVVGEIKMGGEARVKLDYGEAAQISTGGMLPADADAVVMLEDTEWIDDKNIAVVKPVAPGENVVSKGEDIKEGERLFTVNHRIRPQDMGALAAVGYNIVPVWKPLRVGIISTGNELVSPADRLEPGKIRDINSYTLYGMVEQSGGKPKLYGIVRDDFKLLKEKVDEALMENDLVLLSGGSSVGTRDLSLKVLEELEGFKVLFHGISIKPGKPALVAAGNNKIVCGLPGHPVSAMVTFKILVEPAIRGTFKAEPVKIRAIMRRSISSTPGREEHVRVRLISQEDNIFAEPVLGKSALINTMVKSDGEIIIPLGKEGVQAGEEVQVVLFKGGY